MHKLCEYIDKELEELEHKAGTGQKLSAGEIQYGDMLAHFKKSLLTNDAMEGYDDDYSNDNRAMRDNRSMRGNNYRSMRGNSMARGRTGNVRRDSMGRYSRDDALDDMVDELEELMEKAPDEQTKKEFRKFINKVQAM